MNKYIPLALLASYFVFSNKDDEEQVFESEKIIDPNSAEAQYKRFQTPTFDLKEEAYPSLELKDLLASDTPSFDISQTYVQHLTGSEWIALLGTTPDVLLNNPMGTQVFVGTYTELRKIGQIIAAQMYCLFAYEGGSTDFDKDVLDKFSIMLRNTEFTFLPANVQRDLVKFEDDYIEQYYTNPPQTREDQKKRDFYFNFGNPYYQGTQNGYSPKKTKYQIYDTWVENLNFFMYRIKHPTTGFSSSNNLVGINYKPLQSCSYINKIGIPPIKREIRLSDYLKTKRSFFDRSCNAVAFCERLNSDMTDSKERSSHFGNTCFYRDGIIQPRYPDDKGGDPIGDLLLWRVFASSSSTFVYEYALLDFISLLFAQMTNPQLGQEAGKNILKGATEALNLVMTGASIGGTWGAIAGAVAGLIVFAGRFIESLVSLSQDGEDFKEVASKKSLEILKKYFLMEMKDLSGLRFPELLYDINASQIRTLWDYFLYGYDFQLPTRFLSPSITIPMKIDADAFSTTLLVVKGQRITKGNVFYRSNDSDSKLVFCQTEKLSLPQDLSKFRV